MATITCSIEIAAAEDTVWKVLADLDSYRTWNPYYREDVPDVAGGKGSIEDALLGPATSANSRYHEEAGTPVLDLKWTSRRGIPGLFDVAHRITVTSDGAESSRIERTARVTGVLAPFSRRTILEIHRLMESQNEALKTRAEGIATVV